MAAETPAGSRPSARTRLLDAAVDVVRRRGLSATSVDELCKAAGVTKGAFFHHFESKEALAVAAVEHWTATTGALFASAPYHQLPDPLDRIYGYLDLREALVVGAASQYSCLAGTMVQEAFDTYPAIREACGESILGHAGSLVADFQAAIDLYRPGAGLDAVSLARHTQTVLQGAFIVSKAANDPSVVLESIEHLRRYTQLLFNPGNQEGEQS